MSERLRRIESEIREAENKLKLLKNKGDPFAPSTVPSQIKLLEEELVILEEKRKEEIKKLNKIRRENKERAEQRKKDRAKKAEEAGKKDAPPPPPRQGKRQGKRPGGGGGARVLRAPLPKRSARRPPTARTNVIYTSDKSRNFLVRILEFLRNLVRPSAPKPGQGKRGSLLQPPLAGPSTESPITVADIIRSTIPQELLNLFRVPDVGPSTTVGGFTIPAPNPKNSETDITTEEVFSSVLGPAMARAILSIPQALQRIPFPTRILDVLAQIGNYLYLLVNQDQITYLGLIEDIDLTPYLDMEYSEVYCRITNVIRLLKERIEMIDESGYEIICNILFIRNFILYRVDKNQVISKVDLKELERLANNVGVAVREYFDLDKVRLVISEETANATRETVEDVIETYRSPREQGDEGAGTGAFF